MSEQAAMLAQRYPVMSANAPGQTAKQALAVLVEQHDTTESIRTREVATQRIRNVLTDVERHQEQYIKSAQEHERRRAEVCADARDLVRLMDDLAEHTGPVSDDVLQALDEYESLSKRIAAAADRMVIEADFIAAKLRDPLQSLSTLQEKFPTVRKHYL